MWSMPCNSMSLQPIVRALLLPFPAAALLLVLAVTPIDAISGGTFAIINPVIGPEAITGSSRMKGGRYCLLVCLLLA